MASLLRWQRASDGLGCVPKIETWIEEWVWDGPESRGCEPIRVLELVEESAELEQARSPAYSASRKGFRFDRTQFSVHLSKIVLAVKIAQWRQRILHAPRNPFAKAPIAQRLDRDQHNLRNATNGANWFRDRGRGYRTTQIVEILRR
jgi:hypothetical protein